MLALNDFFTSNIRNPNTRRAYAWASLTFFVGTTIAARQLANIRPYDVHTDIETRGLTYSALEVKQQLRRGTEAVRQADAAGIAEERKGFLFRTLRGHEGSILSERPMIQSDAWRMICAGRLGAFDQQLQPLLSPGHVLDVQPDEFGATHCSGVFR